LLNLLIILQFGWILNIWRAIAKEEVVEDHTSTYPVVNLAQQSYGAQILS
jgi:hypothetical protein